MAKLDPEVLAHLEWLGFVQPTGLVVSAPALVRAGANLDRRDIDGQRLLRQAIHEKIFDPKAGAVPYLPDFQSFASTVLGWSFSPKGYAGTDGNPIPPELELSFEGDTIRPDFAVRELDSQNGRLPWQLLVRVMEPEESFDQITRGRGQLEASEHGRMERLLRQTGVAAGLLFNGRALRLLSAPRGESSGWLDFRVSDMLQTAGRPISTAMRLLLGEQRLLSLPRAQRLAALLEESRKFQNEVSEKLAEQVLHALYELLRGFQAANDLSKGDLLRYTLADHPDEVYRALLTVLLRLVFLLYAEERNMLPEDEVFLRNYRLTGLYDRLREDAALYPDTMEQRYGAWAQLLTIFRLIHDGADAGAMHLPKRHGVLFDPDRYPFLEGRRGGARQIHERIDPPLVPDGTIYRALEKLLVLDGERISYRALDVEQIGSVYQTMMGFKLERATGRSVAIRAQKKHGAPASIDLEALLGEDASKREKWLQERADRKLTDRLKKAVAKAATIEELHAALDPVLDRAATPDLVPAGAMVLQPSQERRRSGSHYTPRELTEPIVRTTLEPILARLRADAGGVPKPEQVLELKVCDPALGSGAFLVEACRQLGDALIESWRAHDARPPVPSDEDEVIFARRLVAQRCLYGVDRNPVAVDLAKVSLWLVTLAREHALTFVDHALRHGDSLVGLTRRQIEAFNLDVSGAVLKGLGVREPLDRVFELRRQIREADESVSDRELRELWDEAQRELGKVRLFGDLVLDAFFAGGSPNERDSRRNEYASAALSNGAERYRERVEELRCADRPLVPFHWEIEFPEVFDRENPGFDVVVGNPPFMGGSKISSVLGDGYASWLAVRHSHTHGNGDLVAHFFRCAFDIVRDGGAFGLIATNTIGQGDTRSTGLSWICRNGGHIFCAKRRLKWPGLAAVVVSVVHLIKNARPSRRWLDDTAVDMITAFLFRRGGNDSPGALESNASQSYLGSKIYGQGFIFDNIDPDSTPLSEMRRLVERDPRNAERISPYIGGEELNTSPSHAHHRYVIGFDEMTEAEARQWPDLMAIVEAKVRPERLRLRDNADGRRRKQYWWQWGRYTPALFRAIAGLPRVLVISRISNSFGLTFLPAGMTYNEKIVIFPMESWEAFCAMQARIHEVWTRCFSSTLKDDLQYTASACFETFPFPKNWKSEPTLGTSGREYFEFRAALMVRHDEGLTKTYNRFHDPDERDPDILKLRELHAAMDRAVLDAYGWTDIRTDCEFLLDYEIDEEEWGDKKKPWRYRWPDEVRDEVLARLLELNAERHQEEVRGAITAPAKVPRKSAKKAKPDTGSEGKLF